MEGNSDSSLDFPLYTALFPDISVIPQGSCEEVQKAVLGLRGTSDRHDVGAFGLIDRDNRKGEDVKRLEKKGVFALEVYSVEALYYCSDAIAAVADQQAEIRGEDSAQLIESAKKESIKVLKDHAEEMAAKRCMRQIQELTLSKIPNSESIKDNSTQSFCITIDSELYSKELAYFYKLAAAENLDKLIARYPVRQSCALEKIATSLKCKNKTDYEKIVINLIRHDEGLQVLQPLSETVQKHLPNGRIEKPELIRIYHCHGKTTGKNISSLCLSILIGIRLWSLFMAGTGYSRTERSRGRPLLGTPKMTNEGLSIARLIPLATRSRKWRSVALTNRPFVCCSRAEHPRLVVSVNSRAKHTKSLIRDAHPETGVQNDCAIMRKIAPFFL